MGKQTDRLNVLIIGGGGREHAFAWKLQQSPRLGKLYIAPGNGGTREIATNISISPTSIDDLIVFAKENDISLTVVGPEDPLALGIAGKFKRAGLKIFGASQLATTIESSKPFAKKLMLKRGIPTADFRIFSRREDAVSYLRLAKFPIVIKAGGLAQGKGVYVCQNLDEALTAISEIMVMRVHNEAGQEVVIEEFLVGPEISIHAICDGYNHVLFPPAQDHKPINDGDLGKNTGGMGTIAPVPWVTQDMLYTIDKTIVTPTLHGIFEDLNIFTGLLYPGLKMTDRGPKVLEFNARFGDPETQVYMRLLKTDLLEILLACCDSTLHFLPIEWHPGFAVCIVLTAAGYPGTPIKGDVISGIAEANQVKNVVVFHAGTSLTHDKLKTSGGRVLGVSATGETLEQALTYAYTAVEHIHFKGMHYWTDIGQKSLRH